MSAETADDPQRETPPLAIALTCGEPAGVGPELCLRVAAAGSPGTRLVLLGDSRVLSARARALDMDVRLGPYGETGPGLIEVIDIPTTAPVTAGRLDPANAGHVLALLDRATDGCLSGEFAAMATAPVHKGVINEAGHPFTGHTEYLAARCRAPVPVMMLVADALRVALVTTHLPLREVPAAITRERLESVSRILHRDLRTRFGIARPRILVCGLNPHAGEGGHLGREEIDTIAPVMQALRDEGLDLDGPIPADTAFTSARLEGCDAVLAMYHDQGLPVLKHAGFGRAVNVTLGLPIVRTSVDHGTALDLAGSGRADPGSLRAAVELARDLAGASRR